MGESEQHHILKQIGFGILLRKGCSPVGIEIELPIYEDNMFNLDYGGRHVCDVAGVSYHTIMRKGTYRKERIRTLYAIEVKVSKEDFRRGFCTNGWGKLWIIAPPDVIPSEKLPGGVGLYECNLKRKILKLKHKSAFSGYELSPETERRTIEKMVWCGYSYSIKSRLDDFPIVKEVLEPKTLDDFYEEGEDKPIEIEEEEEK